MAADIARIPGDPKRVFVARIPRGTTEDELRDVFGGVGAIEGIEIANQRRRFMYAFVNYASEAAAAAAVSSLAGVVVNDSELRVEADTRADIPKGEEPPRRRGRRQARGDDAAAGAGTGSSRRRRRRQRQREIRIRGLPEDVSEGDVRGLFEEFGEITKIKITERAAFVRFTTQEATDAAEAGVNDTEFEGATLDVYAFRPQPVDDSEPRTRRRRRRQRAPSPFTVFIGNIGREVTGEDIEGFFDGVVDVRLRGRFGFVKFGDEAGAAAAVARNGAEIKGYSMVVELPKVDAAPAGSDGPAE